MGSKSWRCPWVLLSSTCGQGVSELHGRLLLLQIPLLPEFDFLLIFPTLVPFPALWWNKFELINEFVCVCTEKTSQF